MAGPKSTLLVPGRHQGWRTHGTGDRGSQLKGSSGQRSSLVEAAQLQKTTCDIAAWPAVGCFGHSKPLPSRDNLLLYKDLFEVRRQNTTEAQRRAKQIRVWREERGREVGNPGNIWVSTSSWLGYKHFWANSKTMLLNPSRSFIQLNHLRKASFLTILPYSAVPWSRSRFSVILHCSIYTEAVLSTVLKYTVLKARVLASCLALLSSADVFLTSCSSLSLGIRCWSPVQYSPPKTPWHCCCIKTSLELASHPFFDLSFTFPTPTSQLSSWSISPSGTFLPSWPYPLSIRTPLCPNLNFYTQLLSYNHPSAQKTGIWK